MLPVAELLDASVAVTVYGVALRVVSCGIVIDVDAGNEPVASVVTVMSVKVPPLKWIVVKLFGAKPVPLIATMSSGNA